MLLNIFLVSACAFIGGSLAKDENGTDIKNYPYEVSVQQYGKYKMCAGSIITLKVVLTAGRCAYRIERKSLSVRAGSSLIGFGGKIKQVRKAHTHPNYNPSTMDYDVAILHLDSKLTSSDTVSAITVIPISKDVEEGTEAVVSGWGKYPEDLTLQFLEVTVVSNEACADRYGEGSITSRMLCAGPPATLLREVSCSSHHDAGGPLVAGDKLVGVLSWGTGCTWPAVYAKLSDRGIGRFIWSHTL